MRQWSALAAVTFACLVVGCNAASRSTNSGSANRAGHWTTKAPLPTPRQEMPSALIGERIYTPGGFDAQGQASAVMEVYEVAADRWSPAPPMPEGRHHPGVAAADGKVFVIGGYVPGPFPGPASDAVFAFDPGTQTWSRRRPMPSPRAAHVSVEFNGKIYSIGGVQNGAAVGTNEMYDPATDSWRALSAMPTPREHLAAAVVGDRILVVGGRAPRNTAALEAYTPATDRWEQLPNMPTPRGGLAAAALGGRLYAFGGEVPGVFPNTEEYDPATNAWRRMADMPTPRHGLGAVTTNGVVYLIGGGIRAGFGASGVNEAFTVP
jgi:N-acetylneuraminic acid mutarotase